MIGAFMAGPNIQITNASLPDIQGAIGAGIDDGGWISTAYLVAEIVAIPLTGFMTSVFSLRRYLLANTILFLLLSVSGAFADGSEPDDRAAGDAGAFGGTLIPLASTITLTTLPPIQAADRAGAVCALGDLRAGDRADDWRVSDRDR